MGRYLLASVCTCVDGSAAEELSTGSVAPGHPLPSNRVAAVCCSCVSIALVVIYLAACWLQAYPFGSQSITESNISPCCCYRLHC
jgi:hypothetical protein